jgi:hypothetical protein
MSQYSINNTNRTNRSGSLTNQLSNTQTNNQVQSNTTPTISQTDPNQQSNPNVNLPPSSFRYSSDNSYSSNSKNEQQLSTKKLERGRHGGGKISLTKERRQERLDKNAPYPSPGRSEEKKSRWDDSPKQTKKSRWDDSPKQTKKSRWDDSPKQTKEKDSQYQPLPNNNLLDDFPKQPKEKQSLRNDSPSLEYGGLLSFQSVDPNEYLKKLGESSSTSKNTGLLDPNRISTLSLPKPKNVFDSGKTNQDCVLGAFASAVEGRVKPQALEDRYNSMKGTRMTSTDEALPVLADIAKMRKTTSLGELKTHLQQGGRAFIRAQAMEGEGWHAYCALGTDQHGRIIAWDPDTQYGQDCKAIPPKRIDKSQIYLT